MTILWSYRRYLLVLYGLRPTPRSSRLENNWGIYTDVGSARPEEMSGCSWVSGQQEEDLRWGSICVCATTRTLNYLHIVSDGEWMRFRPTRMRCATSWLPRVKTTTWSCTPCNVTFWVRLISILAQWWQLLNFLKVQINCLKYGTFVFNLYSSIINSVLLQYSFWISRS